MIYALLIFCDVHLSLQSPFVFQPNEFSVFMLLVRAFKEQELRGFFFDWGWILLTQFQSWPLTLLLLHRVRKERCSGYKQLPLFTYMTEYFIALCSCLTAAWLPHFTALCLLEALPANREKGILWKRVHMFRAVLPMVMSFSVSFVFYFAVR